MARRFTSSLQRYRAFLEQVRGGTPSDGRASGGNAGAGTESGLPSRQVSFAYYRRWLRPHLATVGLLGVLALVGIALDMVWPLVSAFLVDHIMLDEHLPTQERVKWLLGGGAFMLSLFACNSGLNWWRGLRTQLMTSRLSFTLRSQLYNRVLHLPLSRITELKTGGVLARVSGDVDHATGLVQQALIGPALALVRLTGTLVIIFALNYRIATVILLAVPPILLLQTFWARRMRRIWRSLHQDRQEIDARISEGIGGVRVVRGFRGEKREELAHTVGYHTVVRKQMLATKTQRSVGVIWDLIMPVAQVTIVCFGGYLVVKGNATLGTLVAFQAYLFRLLEPILQIANSISETQRGLASLDRVVELLQVPEDKPDRPSSGLAPRHVEEVRFENVGFFYRPAHPVIEDFSLRVPGGSVVALVGPSGAGKTTITDLLARFYDPTSGSILVNGVDIRELRLKSYRGLLGIVAQDVFLFDGTVHDNIAYGRAGASPEMVRDAARRANADEFIDRLPEGYQTLIGERGVRLSGGQRQRLSIARALLADPQILILDEATSNLDTESEQLIRRSLGELLRHRTTFVIAHRLSTIMHASIIVVMDQGRIVQAGTHAELLAAGGRYRTMVERQLGDLAGDGPNPVQGTLRPTQNDQ